MKKTYLKLILKRQTNKNLDNFLSINIKISYKKKQLLNVFKQKLIMDKQNPETVVISFLKNCGNKNLPTSIFIATSNTDIVNFIIINAYNYYLA